MSLVTDLREIERLHDQLLSTAMRGGNNGRLNAAAPIPGGPATDALGPWSFGLNDGSDKVAYSEALQERYRNEHWNDWRRENHPLLTLATWSMCWRDWFGHTEELLRIKPPPSVPNLLDESGDLGTPETKTCPDCGAAIPEHHTRCAPCVIAFIERRKAADD